MAFKNIKGNLRGSNINGFNVSGKAVDYHSAEETAVVRLIPVTVNAFDTSGANPQISTYNLGSTSYLKFETAGYYVMSFPASMETSNIDMWVWGAGGAAGANGPGPKGGGAGGGVRGRYSVTAGSTLTFLVGQSYGAGYKLGGFPDGGNGGTSYAQAAGGGSSRIGAGTIPYPTRNNAPTTYLLIGGGGGGGSDYLDAGTYGGFAGYPSGQPGGSYYPTDGTVFGSGGTQSAGGAGGGTGRYGSGTSGGKYSGGPGEGGGGGGGYYGGGGAGGYYAHGGGGSSYINPSLTNTGSFNATVGATESTIAVDDPLGVKPASAGNKNSSGVVIFKLV